MERVIAKRDATACYYGAVAFLVVTVVFLAMGYQEYRTEMRLSAEGTTVRGTIQSVKTNGRRTPVRYEIDVAYTGPNGRRYTQTFMATHATYQGASATIDVVCLPSDPAVSRIESIPWWIKVVAGVFFGAIVVFLGLCGLWRHLRG